MDGILEFLGNTPPATILFLVGIAFIVLGLVSKIPLGKDRAIEIEPGSRRIIALAVGFIFVIGAIVWMIVPPQCTTPPCPTPTPTVTVVTATSTITPAASSTPTPETATATPTVTTEPTISASTLDELKQVDLWETRFRRLPTGLSFGPNSTRLAVGLEDGSIQIWQISLGTLILEDPAAHLARVTTLAYSPPDGNLLASGSWDTKAKLWRASGDELSPQHIFHTDQDEFTIQSVAFSPTGLTLATGLGNNEVYLFNVSNGVLLERLRVGEPDYFVASLSFSADESMIAVGSSEGAVQVWRFSGEGDPMSRAEWLNQAEPASSTRSVAFSVVDSSDLASGHEDGSVRIWNANTGRVRFHTQVPSSIRSIAFSTDGTVLAVATELGFVHLLSGDDLKELRTPLELAGDIPAIAFSADGKLLAVGSPEGVSIWKIGP